MSVMQGLRCCNFSTDCFWCSSKCLLHWGLIQIAHTAVGCLFRSPGAASHLLVSAAGDRGPDRRGSMPLLTPRLHECGGGRDPAGRSRGHAGHPGRTVRRLATLALNCASGIGRGPHQRAQSRWQGRRQREDGPHFPLSCNGTRTSAPTPVPGRRQELAGAVSSPVSSTS
jgi:hypothetical protein